MLLVRLLQPLKSSFRLCKGTVDTGNVIRRNVSLLRVSKFPHDSACGGIISGGRETLCQAGQCLGTALGKSYSLTHRRNRPLWHPHLLVNEPHSQMQHVVSWINFHTLAKNR